MYSAAVQTNTSCNPVIILYAKHHFIEQTNFVRLYSSFCRFRNAFCLLKQLDFLQLQLFVTNMGFNNILFAFAVHLDFETKKLRITLTNIDNACFLWGNFQVQPLSNPLRYRNHCFFCILTVTAENTKIICVTHDKHFFEICFSHFAVALAFIKDFGCADHTSRSIAVSQRMFHPLTVYPMIEFIQYNICQQR